MLTAHFHLFRTVNNKKQNKTETTAGHWKQIIRANNLSSRNRPTFCLTFIFSDFNIIITNNARISPFHFDAQGFSFQIGYCEVDDQLPGRSIPQYTLYLTVANEKERLDWIRALRVGKWRDLLFFKKNYETKLNSHRTNKEISKSVICKHLDRQKKVLNFNKSNQSKLQIYYVHWKRYNHFMNIQEIFSQVSSVITALAVQFKVFSLFNELIEIKRKKIPRMWPSNVLVGSRASNHPSCTNVNRISQI